MEFATGVAAGAGTLLALAGAVFVMFPEFWPQPMARDASIAHQSATATMLPRAVPPSTSQIASSTAPATAAAPTTGGGRSDAMPMVATAPASSAPAQPSPPIVKTASRAQTQPEEPLPALQQVSLKGAHAIYLSSFPDAELAESGWQILERRYRQGLKDLKPQIVEGRDGRGNRVYRLFAGPLPSASDAAQRCSALSYASLNCRPADFTGADSPTAAGWEG